ncbi:MAG: chloride channel protein [Dehalococcoidia bacterium]
MTDQAPPLSGRNGSNSRSGIRQRVRDRFERLSPDDAAGRLGDFTAGPRTILISLIAIIIGGLSAFIALALLRLIAFFTNVFFFQRLSTSTVSPAGNHLGVLVILVPVIGGLIVGLMARYGSEKIRGHGIPEAIESILINGSRIQPRVALLKPVSSAISIGSGGPFGAEGPIIMTGGAVGSLVAQFLHLTNAERKTLLVAGAAGGMAATFAAPVAAVLLVVELLLFEWKPRSLIPVALAIATAAGARRYLLGLGPLFPTPPHAAFIGPGGLLSCLAVGLAAGALSALLTVGVYAAEDSFHRLPIHWMWWPAIGGLVIGLGGLVFPRALGVGYDTIGSLLQGKVTSGVILGILLVKSTVWIVYLGSGTSGGVLAPLLMMGGALGGLASYVLPNAGPGFWPLVSMAAILGGTMRAPFTGIIFAVELTHDVNMMLPLLIAAIAADGFTVLVLRRSILTEKVSRRGYHMSREYSVDPLEIIFVREAMKTNIVTIPAGSLLRDLAQSFLSDRDRRKQGLYPVVNSEGKLNGVVTRTDILDLSPDERLDGRKIAELVKRDPVVAYPDEPLRAAVYRMAEFGVTRMPVVDREQPKLLVGLISLNDLLSARLRTLDEERRRERVLRVHTLFSNRARHSEEAVATEE